MVPCMILQGSQCLASQKAFLVISVTASSQNGPSAFVIFVSFHNYHGPPSDSSTLHSLEGPGRFFQRERLNLAI